MSVARRLGTLAKLAGTVVVAGALLAGVLLPGSAARRWSRSTPPPCWTPCRSS